MSEITNNLNKKLHFKPSGLIFLRQKTQNIINQHINKNDVNEENRDSSKLACCLPCYPLIPVNELHVTYSISMYQKMKKNSLL